ncbi:unnamed protein product [Rhizophagus irregularis]|nr:unnamed protein product [Rhizophagus irregularis]
MTEECEEDGFDPTLLPLPTTSTKTATQRIYKELKIIVHKQDTPSNDLGFFVKLDKLRSVYQWGLYARHKLKALIWKFGFAPDYPNLPPYIRVIRPRLLRS